MRENAVFCEKYPGGLLDSGVSRPSERNNGYLLDLFDPDLCDVDRRGVAMLAHVELKAAVIVVLVLHFELESICLPVGRHVDRCVGQVADPAGVRGGHADDALSSLVGLDIESDFVLVALDHRKVGLDKLD